MSVKKWKNHTNKSKFMFKMALVTWRNKVSLRVSSKKVVRPVSELFFNSWKKIPHQAYYKA